MDSIGDLSEYLTSEDIDVSVGTAQDPEEWVFFNRSSDSCDKETTNVELGL